MNALDKEEFRIKLEEINKLVQDKDYKGAMNIVDSIDWRRVKNVRTLCVVGEIYAANGRYEDSKEIFLLAYHKASIGKNILYRLIEISLRMDDINEAEEFFEEYKQVASNDSTQYILQYKIARAKNSSLNEQIRILEEYKEQEFTEKWSYELAALYYKAGEKQKCLDLCNEIILWFSEGKYVMKAYDLKMRMGELTGAEKAKFEKQFVPKLLTPEQAKELEKKKTETEVKAQEEPEAEEVEETTENNEPEVQVSMEGIQEKISKGIRDVFGGKTQEEKEEFSEESMDMVNEAGITREDEIPEEIIKSDASQKEPENVPELEAEPEKPGAEPMAAIKMPELNIPESMKNMELSKPPKVEEVAETKLNMDSFDLEGKELNLEDTILAAASAQGIEIPKEEESKTEEVQEESSETDVDDKEIKAHDISEELEEPDFLSGDIQDIKVADPKLHPKHKTPVNSLYLIGALTMLAPFAGRTMMVWICDAGNFGCCLAYCMVSVSFLILRKKEPDMARPYKVGHYKFVGFMAVVMSGLMLLVYCIPGSGGSLVFQEWFMVGGWSLLGVVFYAICKRKYKEDFGKLIELISDEDAASLMPEADDEELDVVIDAAIDRVLSSMA